MSDDFDPVTAMLPRLEAEAAFEAWREEQMRDGREIDDDDIRVDIARGLDGHTVYRYAYRRRPKNDNSREASA